MRLPVFWRSDTMLVTKQKENQQMELNDIKSTELKKWLQGWIDLCTPDNVVFFDGTQKQYDEISYSQFF